MCASRCAPVCVLSMTTSLVASPNGSSVAASLAPSGSGSFSLMVERGGKDQMHETACIHMSL